MKNIILLCTIICCANGCWTTNRKIDNSFHEISDIEEGKVHIFWEGRKTLKNYHQLSLSYVKLVEISQNYVAFSYSKIKLQILQRVINTNLVLSIYIRYQINWIISKVFFSFFLASNKLLAPLRSEIGTCLIFRCQFSVLDNANTI